MERLSPLPGVESNRSLVEFIRTSPDEVMLGRRFQKVILALGFAHYIYCQIDVSQPRLYMICSTYPDAIRRVWADASVAVRDPLIAHIINRTTPVRRTDIGDDGSWAQDIFEELEGFGVHTPAWHFPVRDQTNYMGLFGIAPKKVDYETLGPAHFEHAEMLMPALCNHAHETWCSLTANAGEDTPVLSDRETEILNWLSHGKSTEDIAEIMQIAERTVNYHVANLKTKLGVETRAHAVAQAMRLRLI
ncbi:LuxR C-terminal-related transcriptional regulator [Iodidimonas sp. SYSU 1G8]|uniref:helix-turn-helix transcriptional regulator n=1 Tax=Iodidimonas sp. SYSU 1G8 TaxID=3133967 RepID=UPI0031FEE3E5